MNVLGRYFSQESRKKITTIAIKNLKRQKIPVSMCTAYSYPQALHVDNAGIDIILVGDSLGMVELGYQTTIPVTLDDLIHHTKSVQRANPKALVVADMPFGTFGDPKSAYENAVRVFRECNADAVKLEGGSEVCDVVKYLVTRGISVMGHVGLTPQSISTLGGFRAQGKTYESSVNIYNSVIELEKSGCFSIVAECIPTILGKKISDATEVPIIGIGAGKYCDGQVLVYHDILGIIPGYKKPSFSKTYGNLSHDIINNLKHYNDDVKTLKFPEDIDFNFKLDEVHQKKLEDYINNHQKDRSGEDNLNGLPQSSEQIKVY